MKYAIGSSIALVVCIVVAVVAVRVLNSRRENPWGRGARVGLSVVGSLALFAIVGACYLLPYSHADAEGRAALEGSETVHVSTTSKGYFFDGPGTETALVFYPGAKVDSVAYTPLMRRLAEGGDDCFLVKMPLHIAMFDGNAAADLMASYDYDRWILAGHSLGGSAAASFAASHAGEVDGLVLLASYPTKQLPEGLSLVSVYGTEDGVLDHDRYEKNRSLWPSDAREVVIEGGNHAQFGSYGAQRGDNPATISPEAQLEQTVAAILAM